MVVSSTKWQGQTEFVGIARPQPGDGGAAELEELVNRGYDSLLRDWPTVGELRQCLSKPEPKPKQHQL